MPYQYWDDEDDSELGFVGAAIKAVGGAAKGIAKIGKVFKKKKKAKKKKAAAKKAPAGKVLNLEPQNIVGTVPSDAAKAKQKIKAAAKGLDPNDVRGIVKEVVGSVPSPVRAVVLEALRAYRDESAANAQARTALTEQVDAALKPDITAMLAVLEAQRLQGAATHEHKELVAREEFRNKTKEGLGAILSRLQTMENDIKRLNKSAIVSPSRIPVFGNRNVLDG